MRPPSSIPRALVLLLAGGIAALAAVGGGGRLLEQQRFGPDAAAARQRVATAVQAAVQDLERRLERLGAAVPVESAALQLASQHEAQAERRLFDELTVAGRVVDGEVAATLYGTTPVPVAWTGRPVELPDARLAGPEAVFLVPDAQGLRLVHVHPLADPRDGRQRVGTLVLLAPRARTVPGDESGSYDLSTAVVPVRVRPRFEGGIEGAGDEFVLRAAGGEVLAAVSVSDASLSAARGAFRRRVQALMTGVVVAMLLLATGPLLDWRRLTRRRGLGVAVTIAVGVILLLGRMLAGIGIEWAALQAGQPPISGTRG